MAYILKRGDTLEIYLRDVDGTVAPAVEAMQMHFRPALKLTGRADPAKVAVAELTVEPVAAVGDTPGGWRGEIDGGITKDFPLGPYVLDARMTFAGGAEQTTDPVEYEVVEPATARDA